MKMREDNQRRRTQLSWPLNQLAAQRQPVSLLINLSYSPPYMNKKEEFSTVFRVHGRSLPDSRTAPDVAEKAEKQIRFYSSIAPAICVGIVENRTFNAIATRNNFREFIALYSGALTQLTMYAYQLFSDPAFYPDIGDVSIEKSEPQIIERLKRPILPTQ